MAWCLVGGLPSARHPVPYDSEVDGPRSIGPSPWPAFWKTKTKHLSFVPYFVLILLRFLSAVFWEKSQAECEDSVHPRSDTRCVPSQWETAVLCNDVSHWLRASLELVDSRFAPNQWEMALVCNDVSHWLGANLESALYMVMYICVAYLPTEI